MTTTPNLGIEHLVFGQTDKEAAVNTGLDELDSTVAGLLIHDMTSDANYTLTAGEEETLVIKVTDSGTNLTATRDIIVPDQKHMYVFWNNTSTQSLQIKTAAGSGVTVADAEKKLVYCDGTNVEVLSGLQTTEYPMDIKIFKAGLPTSSEVLFVMAMTRTTEFPASMVNSQGDSDVAANASTTFTFAKNGTSFATANFAASAKVVTWTAASATTFNTGDILKVTAPASADANLADIGFNLKVSNLA